MLDAAFTYGGAAVSLIALGAWFWLARRSVPSFEAFVRDFDDELHLGATAEERAAAARRHRILRAALALTAVAALCLSIAYAIPG